MEALINAANTSHILQPCDQLINKRFHELMRDVRDEFFRQGCVDATRVNFNLSCAVYAWERITPEIIQSSFKVTGTFPFKRNFAEKYKTFKDEQAKRVKQEENCLGDMSVASRLLAVRKRRSDQDVFNKMMRILFSTSLGVSTKIKEIHILLKKEKNFNNILMENINGKINVMVKRTDRQGRKLYDKGAPAAWVTHREEIKRRKEEADKQAAIERERQVEKANKCMQRVKAREQAEAAAEKRAAEREQKRQQKLAARAEKRANVLQGRREKQLAAQEKERARRLNRLSRALGQETAKKQRAQRVVAAAGGSRRKRTPVSAFQFAATLVLEPVEDAVDIGVQST